MTYDEVAALIKSYRHDQIEDRTAIENSEDPGEPDTEAEQLVALREAGYTVIVQALMDERHLSNQMHRERRAAAEHPPDLSELNFDKEHRHAYAQHTIDNELYRIAAGATRYE